jgi:hypothetical protein
MIFAREIDGNLTSLVKKVDAATGKHSDCSMGSFIVMLSDDEKMEGKLKDLAEKEKLKNVVLTVMEDKAGPRGYDINPKADVTVVLYTNRTVKVNHAFKKGELKAKDVDKIVGEVSKILPEK